MHDLLSTAHSLHHATHTTGITATNCLIATRDSDNLKRVTPETVYETKQLVIQRTCWLPLAFNQKVLRHDATAVPREPLMTRTRLDVTPPPPPQITKWR